MRGASISNSRTCASSLDVANSATGYPSTYSGASFGPFESGPCTRNVELFVKRPNPA
jgi:hypothetical protein